MKTNGTTGVPGYLFVVACTVLYCRTVLLFLNACCDAACGGNGPMASWPQAATGRGKLS